MDAGKTSQQAAVEWPGRWRGHQPGGWKGVAERDGVRVGGRGHAAFDSCLTDGFFFSVPSLGLPFANRRAVWGEGRLCSHEMDVLHFQGVCFVLFGVWCGVGGGMGAIPFFFMPSFLSLSRLELPPEIFLICMEYTCLSCLLGLFVRVLQAFVRLDVSIYLGWDGFALAGVMLVENGCWDTMLEPGILLY